MAGRVDELGVDGSEFEGLAVAEQLVELTAVALERAFGIEDLCENALDDVDLGADAGLAAELFLKIRRGGQVVGVNVGFENPLDGQVVPPHIGDDVVRRFRLRAAGGGVVVQQRVDDRGFFRRRVADNMARGEGLFIEKSFYMRFHNHLTLEFVFGFGPNALHNASIRFERRSSARE